MHLRRIRTSLTTHSQGRHPREILNLTRRTKLSGTAGSNSTVSVLDQPLSKYFKLPIDEQGRGRGDDDHAYSRNVDDTTGKRKKGSNDVLIDSHLARSKRPKQRSQSKEGGVVRQDASVRREDIGAGHNAGEMKNGRNGVSADVSGWQRLLSANPSSQSLPAIENTIRKKGNPPSYDNDGGRWMKCGAKHSVAELGAHKQRNKAKQDRQENTSNKGARTFRTLVTAVKMKTDYLLDGGDRSDGPLSVDAHAEKSPAPFGAHNISSARRSSSSSRTTSSILDGRTVFEREQSDHSRDVDELRRPSSGCSAAGNDPTRVHPLQLPGDRLSPISSYTFTSDLSPSMEFSGQQALTTVDFNCQSQLSPPVNNDAPLSRSLLPSWSLHGGDVEFVSKDFGDSLLSDCRTSEGRSICFGSTTGLSPSATVRVSCGQDTMFSPSFWKFVRNSEPDNGRRGGWDTENSTISSLKIESERWRANDNTTGVGAEVRSSPGLPPTPTALSLQSPNHDNASWGSRL